jgi:L-seryl-tRNA(Ser) seleniumtransferase
VDTTGSRPPQPISGKRVGRRMVAIVDPRRQVPRTDVVLADRRLVAARELLGGALVKVAVTRARASGERSENGGP